MKERVLKDKEKILRGDTIFFTDGTVVVEGESSDGWTRFTVESAREYLKRERFSIKKVTRPGGEKMKEKIKQYPKKFFVQHVCPSNDDDSSLDVGLVAQDFDLTHPMLEITQTKGKFSSSSVFI